MLFWTIFKVGMGSLLANKMRSLLAMLGIIIGVGAVITSVAIGIGAKKQVLARITAMGSNLLVLRPGQTGSHGVASGTSQRLKIEDAEAIAQEISNVQAVAPVVNGQVQTKYLSHNNRTSVNGVSATWLPIRDFTVEKGRSFTDAEVENNAHVAILGPVTVQNLFVNDEPLGQTIRLNNLNFTVVGVLKAKGDQGWFSPDDQVLIPYSTAMKQLFGLDYLREIDVQAVDGGNLDKVQEDITALIRKRHRTQPGEPDDFSIRNQADLIQNVSASNQVFTDLLRAIAAVSLLVGGIGIMNIMLVSVTERTREIGIRKAIGARRSNILTQFLLEAMIISGLGGLIGLGAGLGASKLVATFSQFATEIDWISTIIAVAFSGVVGIIFGLYPAWRAARLDPVVALRYE